MLIIGSMIILVSAIAAFNDFTPFVFLLLGTLWAGLGYALWPKQAERPET